MFRPCDLDTLLDPALIAATHALADLQEADGTIAPARHARARELLPVAADLAGATARACGQAAYAKALAADIERWIAAGLDTPPDFGAARDAIVPPRDGAPFFFFGPLRLANGGRTGWRFETFLAWREEPSDPAYLRLYARFPHPANICQSSHLIDGTAGLMSGNNIVFFPENIQAATPVAKQDYAVFFFNKFHRIYNEITLPAVRAAADGLAIRNPTGPDPRANYKARCVWGYLHDYFHHQGARPFDTNVAIKTRWFTGLLEEIKVDLQSYLACRESDLVDAEAVAEFILLDRSFRYPLEPDWNRNFDSGTGLILFAVFEEHGLLSHGPEGRLRLDLAGIPAAARAFIAEVSEIERRPDEAYLAAARELVRRYLPPATGTGRFARPAAVEASALARHPAPPALAFTRAGLAASRPARETVAS
ncbi:DUF6421 family protein [Stappia sp.]|uniref:DUF6421 family protein n=1 Tax=Stappia sp. TaxID=1870903 RepID=UPI0032D8D516